MKPLCFVFNVRRSVFWSPNYKLVILHFCFSLKKQLACCSSFCGFSTLEQPFLYVFSLFSLSTDHCQLSTFQWRISGSNRWPSRFKTGCSKPTELILYYILIFSCKITSLLFLWRISGSNRWPPACKAGALSQLS